MNLMNKSIDQIRYIKTQPKTIDFSAKLWGKTTEFVGFIPQSLVLRSIVLGWIWIYRNWSINLVNAPLAQSKIIARCSSLGLLSQTTTKLEKYQNTYVEIKIEREG